MNDEQLEFHLSGNIEQRIKEMAKMIQFELYNVSKVVDDGNFSKKLENRVPLNLIVE